MPFGISPVHLISIVIVPLIMFNLQPLLKIGRGLVFQLPTLALILVRLRLLTSTILRQQRRIVYFALFVFTEIITPVSDPIVAPLAVMVALVRLCKGSVLLARRIKVGRERRAAAQASATLAAKFIATL